jgi:hypothetical protein
VGGDLVRRDRFLGFLASGKLAVGVALLLVTTIATRLTGYLGNRLDALIMRTVPNVRKAVKGLEPNQAARGHSVARAARIAWR